MQMKNRSNSLSLKNAVLVKEIQVKSKKAGLSLWIMILGIVLALAALITMIVVNSTIVANGSVDSSTFVTFFMVIVVIEAVIFFFITPAVTAGAIANEKERQTLDVLLTTNMSPWQIIWGKYWSSIANVLVIIMSTLPFLSVVFLFGGVSFFEVMAVLLTMMCEVMYMGTFGILMSTAVKKTNAASVLCYIMLLAVTFGTISLVTMITGVSETINDIIWSYYPAKSGIVYAKPDWSIVFLLFSPVTTAYDVMARFFGFDLFYTGSQYGMGTFVELITDSRLLENCILGRFWTVISLAVKLLSGFGILKLAALSLNPVKRRKSAGKTKKAD